MAESLQALPSALSLRGYFRNQLKREDPRFKSLEQYSSKTPILGAVTGELFKRQDGRCIWCRCKLGNDLQVDHFIPRRHGGTHVSENISLCCGSCNSRKHAKCPLAFAREMNQRPDPDRLRRLEAASAYNPAAIPFVAIELERCPGVAVLFLRKFHPDFFDIVKAIVPIHRRQFFKLASNRGWRGYAVSSEYVAECVAELDRHIDLRWEGLPS